MAEKKSIGYIPATPFRDDSDVFILPAESIPGSVDDPTQQTLLAEELAGMRNQRVGLNRRNAEILAAFQLIQSQYSEQSLKAPSRHLAPTLPKAVQTSENSPSPSVVLLPSELEKSPVSAPGVNPPTKSPEPAVPGQEPDRLAALKAQLANRIKSFQNASNEPSSPANERGDS